MREERNGHAPFGDILLAVFTTPRYFVRTLRVVAKKTRPVVTHTRGLICTDGDGRSERDSVNAQQPIEGSSTGVAAPETHILSPDHAGERGAEAH